MPTLATQLLATTGLTCLAGIFVMMVVDQNDRVSWLTRTLFVLMLACALALILGQVWAPAS